MLFTSLEFILFAAIFLAAFHLVPRPARLPLALAASYLFYGWSDWRQVLLLLAVSAGTYLAARAMADAADRNAARRWLLLGVAGNLLLLGTFKYADFLIGADAARLWGWQLGLVRLDLVLPLGISSLRLPGRGLPDRRPPSGRLGRAQRPSFQCVHRPLPATGRRLVVRIPMRFQRRGGRKRIVAADGSELVPAVKPQPDGAIVKALARAHRWQRMLESGEYGTLAELADAERISRSYVCRVLRLTLLAPDIVERILDGRPTRRLATAPEAVPGRVGDAAAATP